MGNEAVDQLVKFNRALADHSDAKKPCLIDGILLTTFDTSMTRSMCHVDLSV